MPHKEPKEIPDKWSHLTDRPNSSTPGFLNEIYYGEAYRVTSEPSYGPNKGPSAAVIEKALSPVEIVDRSSETWWDRAKNTSLCTLNAGTSLHVLFWVTLVLIFCMAMGYIKTPFGNPATTIPTEGERVPGMNGTSIIQTPTNTSGPVILVSPSEGLQNGSPPTTFVTLVKKPL